MTPKENVVTLTVQMPEEAQSRVSVIDDGTINLIDWELGDTVKVYNVQRNSKYNEIEVTGGHVFRCTDLATYTFTGILPEGKTLQDYNVAVYGHDIEPVYNDMNVGFYDNKVSTNLKDVIFLAGEITADSCILDIRNNVVKVTNDNEPIEVAWAWKTVDVDFVKLFCQLDDKYHFAPAADFDGYDIGFSDAKFTIPTGVSYVLLPPTIPFNLGLFDSDSNPFLPAKDFSAMENFTVGKIFDEDFFSAVPDDPASPSVEFKTSDFSLVDERTIKAEKSGIEIKLQRFSGPFSINPDGSIWCGEPAPAEMMSADVSTNVGRIVLVSGSAEDSVPLNGSRWTCYWILDGNDEGWYNGSDKFIDLYIDSSQTITVEYK